MNNITLESVIERYDAAIATLESAGKKLSSEQILEVLIARDAVQAEIADKTRPNPGHLIRKVNELDKRVKQHAESIDWSEPLTDLQSIFNPPKKDWWWLLDPITPKNWRDRYDWAWRFISLILLTISLSVVVNISNRFLSGGPDEGVLAIIVPSVLTLLAGGGALTRPGQEGIEYILTSLKLGKHWWDEIICGVSGLLLVFMVFFWFSLPCISGYYEHLGDKAYCEGQLASTEEAKNNDCTPQLDSAEKRYSRAIILNPENIKAHYKLGKIYAELQDFDNAVAQYKIATKSRILKLKAYNNLARLYLQEKDYTKADKWLGKCLEQAQDNQKKQCTTIVALIQTYIDDKQYAKADNWLWKAVEPQRIQSTRRPYTINNEQYMALKTLARAYLDEGKYANAFRWLSVGLGGTKDDIEKQYTINTYIGWTLLNQERYVEAKAYLQNAISFKGQSQQAPAHCLLAQVIEKNKEQQEAEVEWEQCLAYGDQNNPDEYNWIALANKHKYFQTKGQPR